MLVAMQKPPKLVKTTAKRAADGWPVREAKNFMS